LKCAAWSYKREDSSLKRLDSAALPARIFEIRNTSSIIANTKTAITVMPPRLSTVRVASSLLSTPSRIPISHIVAPFLFPAQQRCASILSSLSDNAGAYNKKIRRGRGPASGKGKTGGRGQKGQHAHGKVPAGFEGGQTPQWITNPDRGRGKYNPFKVEMSPINLDRIQSWIDQGRLDPKKVITMKELAKSRCLHGVKRHGVKLLARVGQLYTTHRTGNWTGANTM
jgi:large subunit ribosomal protein L15